ncbi:MAG TPA: V-type ATPase 116kDa subunit family protein [Kofleriaceae bacterium]|nr:V-type ATPase 116kDa subunit family protein [Kofleriaceae bacterium]
MIIEMARIRVLGPRAQLGAAIRALQDLGIVHLVDAEPIGGLRRHEVDPIACRRQHHLTRALADTERALDGLARLGAEVADRGGPPPREAQAARLAARLAAEVDRLLARDQALADERDALRIYEPLFAELEALVRAGQTQRVSAFLLRTHSPAGLEALRAALERALGNAMELRAHTLASGETVLLLLVAAARAPDIERLLAEARVERAPLPPALAQAPLADALPRMRPRLAEVMRALEVVRQDARSLARTHGDDLARARRGLHDALLALGAAERAATSARVFVLEGWLPAHDRDRLRAAIAKVSPELAIEEVSRDTWHGDDAPVVLANPPLFAPFEALIQLLPLPRYGTVDPTPFVAVFFPMLFGVVVGDVGYGVAIAAIALALRLAGKRTGALARIAAAVSIYTIGFGVLYGELFGDLGARWFGMRPLWFDRRDAVLGFLVLALALGLVHLVLGLGIAAVSRWRRDRREAIGRGLTAVMMILVAVALLALFERLPGVLLTPAVIAILIALPVVVVLEGATALLDFMTILGHVLSYARVMALGTASVMLAVVANRMHGAFGSAAIGIAFALVFHLVNFAITLFSPTIHVMRLHYVEFFGTFFSPGGGAYRPFAHWTGSQEPT